MNFNKQNMVSETSTEFKKENMTDNSRSPSYSFLVINPSPLLQSYQDPAF